MSTVHVPTAEEVAQMPEADKRELLAIVAEDLIGKRPCLPIDLKLGERRIGTLVPDFWSMLPPNDISDEELRRRIRSAGNGITTEELIRRIRAGLVEASEPQCVESQPQPESSATAVAGRHP
jgi:hypothetical protein